MVASTHWNGQDAVDQAWKCRIVQTRNSEQTCFLGFVDPPASLASNGAICARGGVLKFIHVVNNDTTVHDVHTYTVAFNTPY